MNAAIVGRIFLYTVLLRDFHFSVVTTKFYFSPDISTRAFSSIIFMRITADIVSRDFHDSIDMLHTLVCLLEII